MIKLIICKIIHFCQYYYLSYNISFIISLFIICIYLYKFLIEYNKLKKLHHEAFYYSIPSKKELIINEIIRGFSKYKK